MEEDCGGGRGLSWAVEPKGERHKWRDTIEYCMKNLINFMLNYRLLGYEE
jgi:hypothetical protein